MARMIGRIKSVKPIEGYAFLTGPDGVDRLFHHSACIDFMISDTLIGLYVEFDPAIGPKGGRAVNVMLVSNTPSVGLPTAAQLASPTVGMVP